MAERTLYEILMVHPSAETEVISLVFRYLAKRYHPDVDSSVEARLRMIEINEAHDTLTDPVRRARYDAMLQGASGARRVVAVPIHTDGAVPAPTRRDHVSVPSVRPSASASTYGEAGPPPQRPLPSGSVVTFGRYRGWTISQIEAYDRNYVEWLVRTPTGRRFQNEVRSVAGGRD